MPKGVRLNPKHDERTRAKIQTSQIINRLEKLVKGEIEMTTQQVRTVEILLKKSLPDLSAIEHSGEVDTPNQKDLSESDKRLLERYDATVMAKIMTYGARFSSPEGE